MRNGEHAVVLFDDECMLCNGAVRFLLKRDRRARLRFAALRGETGSSLLAQHGMADKLPDSFVLIYGNRLYVESGAALRTFRLLAGAWPLTAVLLVVPRPLRDRIYRFVARNRYRWFGKARYCVLMAPQWKGRFLP